jgi:cyclophilin family peptidyl-prolyl cis-trans isomerase
MRIRVLLVLAGLYVATVCVSGQEKSPPPAKPGPAKAEFDRVFAEWKAVLTEMGKLKEEYRAASKSRQAEIDKLYKDLLAKATPMLEQLIGAAQKAYTEAPNADKDLAELLVGVVADSNARDDYERAFALAKPLMDNKCDDKYLPALAGIAAFCVSEFDLAGKWLEQAAKDQDTWQRITKKDDPGRAQSRSEFLTNVPYYKDAWTSEKRFRDAEAEAKPDQLLPRVLLSTNKGDIEVELFENEAPNTVANYISLVEKGFYNGLTFHRVLPGFMAQGGDPEGNGSGGPGYHIPCECYQPNHRLHFRGTLSMAHAGRDTGGSQFFLTFVPTRHLDGRHTVFGRVVKGFEVLAKLQRRNPEEPDQPRPDRIVEAKVLRKRKHDYVPKHAE